MSDRASLIERMMNAYLDAQAAGGRPTTVNRESMAAALDALVPPGEAWIAPWTISASIEDTLSYGIQDELTLEYIWNDLRDSHLAEPPKSEEG